MLAIGPASTPSSARGTMSPEDATKPAARPRRPRRQGYWAAAAAGVLALPRCSALRPRTRCRPAPCARSAGAPTRAFTTEPVEGGGTVRSWTVVRDSFLPGFADDVPYVLVDVELDAQPEPAHDRPAGRRRRRAARTSATASPSPSTSSPTACAVPAFALATTVSAAASPRATVSRSPATRRARSCATPTARSARSRSTPRAPRSPTPASSVADVDGFTTGSLLPTSGGQASSTASRSSRRTGSPRRSA